MLSVPVLNFFMLAIPVLNIVRFSAFVLKVIVLSVSMLNVIMLSVTLLVVIMSSVPMLITSRLIVMAPLSNALKTFFSKFTRHIFQCLNREHSGGFHIFWSNAICPTQRTPDTAINLSFGRQTFGIFNLLAIQF